MHEDAGEVELDLEADVHVGAVDRGRPPQREAAVGNLVQPRALRVGQLLVLHALLKPARLRAHRGAPQQDVQGRQILKQMHFSVMYVSMNTL